jgi:hypothetical protein
MSVKVLIHIQYTVQPATHQRRSELRLPGTPDTEPLQVIHVTDQEDGAISPRLAWISNICLTLDTQFVVELPDDISIKSPGDFFWEMWTCQQRFKTSLDDQVNKIVFTDPEEFLRERKKLLTRYDGPGGYLKRLFSKR